MKRITEESMRNEKVLLEATLCFLRRGDEVLLARKMKKIGMGCLNAYGGGIDDNEDRLSAAVRELFEESQVVASPHDLRKIAEVFFHNAKSDGTIFVCRVHVYEVWRWQGEPKTTSEMANPQWFALDKLPVAEMMPADAVWLPPALSGKKIVATARYGPFQKKLIGSVLVSEVNEF